MLEVALLIFVMLVLYRQITELQPNATTGVAVKKQQPQQIVQLTEYADRLYQEKRYIPAEKAYLSVLRVDHKNVHAYNHLGVIYSAQKNYADAIECYQIATQIVPNASNFYNLGLSYFENRNYMKAIAALEKSLMFEPTASRYMTLARAYQHVASPLKVTAALEKAVELDPTIKHLTLLAESYTANKNHEKALDTYRRLAAAGPSSVKARDYLAKNDPSKLDKKHS
jgi:tetratricopeptide (TPR) repeat protein